MSPSERTLKILASIEREYPLSLYETSEDLLDHDAHFDRDGEPISFIQWVMLYGEHDYKIVKQDRIGQLFVSTVWLGIDHGWGFSECPIIFETMVFDEGGGEDERWRDIDQWRYCTEEDALAGHEEICEQVRLLEELR